MKVYKSYTIQSNSEIILGLLSAFPFESFEEHDGYMIAYIPEDECDAEVHEQIDEVIHRFEVDYSVETIEPQNWNALWEASFEPVVVEDFCIVRADFHEKPDNIKYDIVINPKMAFGTGHHETTYMMMAAMRKIYFEERSVFDYGCGTGILSILASKMNAESIEAIDIEEESYLNTIENAELNQCTNIITQCTDLEGFPAKKYDIILANINRNVLMLSAGDLYKRLNNKGTILLSGILEEDEKLVSDRYQEMGFKILNVHSRGYWKCIELVK